MLFCSQTRAASLQPVEYKNEIGKLSPLFKMKAVIWNMVKYCFI
jgi:hypothetical protein